MSSITVQSLEDLMRGRKPPSQPDLRRGTAMSTYESYYADQAHAEDDEDRGRWTPIGELDRFGRLSSTTWTRRGYA